MDKNDSEKERDIYLSWREQPCTILQIWLNFLLANFFSLEYTFLPF